MGTRAQITVKTETGFRSVYLHWDGYPEGALVTLRKHYSTPGRAAELVALGDMSVLSERCNGSARHCFDYPEPGQCVFYGRDRGEPWETVRPKDTAVLKPLQAGEEYWYLFDGEAWGEVEESDVEESNAGNEEEVEEEVGKEHTPPTSVEELVANITQGMDGMTCAHNRRLVISLDPSMKKHGGPWCVEVGPEFWGETLLEALTAAWWSCRAITDGWLEGLGG